MRPATRRTRRILVATSCAAAATALAAPSAAASAAHRYDLDFSTLNGSGVGADGFLITHDDDLTVHIDTHGLASNLPHAQHIHGKDDPEVATCPSLSLDTDGDGLISVSEGAPAYGPVRVSLTTTGVTTPAVAFDLSVMPVADRNGREHYTRTFATDMAALGDPTARVVVIHGDDLNGNGVYDNAFESTLPVACAVIVDHHG